MTNKYRLVPAIHLDEESEAILLTGHQLLHQGQALYRQHSGPNGVNARH